METIRALTVGEALERFRQANGITRHEASNAFWTCQLGPIALRLPNFSWRRRAVIAHDLHHVFTGYPCTMRGEFQMAAWELGAGSMPHLGASAICLPLVLIGLFWAPRLMLRAFSRRLPVKQLARVRRNQSSTRDTLTRRAHEVHCFGAHQSALARLCALHLCDCPGKFDGVRSDGDRWRLRGGAPRSLSHGTGIQK